MRRGVLVIIGLGLVGTLVLMLALHAVSKELVRRGGVVSPAEKRLHGALLLDFGQRVLELATVRIHADQGLVLLGGRAQAHRDVKLPAELAAAAWKLAAADKIRLTRVEVEMVDPDTTPLRFTLREAPRIKKPKKPKPPQSESGGRTEGMPGK